MLSKDSGFTFKTDIGLGAKSRSKTDWCDKQFGFAAAFNIGAGYSFIRSDKATLAATADLTGIYKPASHFGFFANLAFRYIFGGFEDFSGYSSSDYTYGIKLDPDFDITGTFSFIPTVGITFIF